MIATCALYRFKNGVLCQQLKFPHEDQLHGEKKRCTVIHTVAYEAFSYD